MISMKKSVSALGCIMWLLSTMTVGAGHQSKTNQLGQPRPDFSGKWVLDFGNSKLGRERALLKITNVILVISHEEPLFTSTETTDYEGLEVTEKMTCYTDERGETNRTNHRSMVVKSKTRWNGSQLVTKASRDSRLSSSEYVEIKGSTITTGITREGGSQPGYAAVTVLRTQHIVNTVKRGLSADGQTLTIVTSLQGYDGTTVITKVFKRAA